MAFVSAGVPGWAQTEEDQRQDVLDVVEAFLDHLSQRDGEAIAQTLLPRGDLLRISGEEMTRRSFEEFREGLSQGDERYLERIFDPTVLIRRSIAQVWAEYDFHLDGRFSHCGVNSFSLVRTPQGWKISGVLYTVERQGCDVRPLGPDE